MRRISNLNDLNTKLCGVRAALDSCSSGLISAIHFVKSLQNKKYETLLPPLMSLSLEEQKALLLKLKKLDFVQKIHQKARILVDFLDKI